MSQFWAMLTKFTYAEGMDGWVLTAQRPVGLCNREEKCVLCSEPKFSSEILLHENGLGIQSSLRAKGPLCLVLTARPIPHSTVGSCLSWRGFLAMPLHVSLCRLRKFPVLAQIFSAWLEIAVLCSLGVIDQSSLCLLVPPAPDLLVARGPQQILHMGGKV